MSYVHALATALGGRERLGDPAPRAIWLWQIPAREDTRSTRARQLCLGEGTISFFLEIGCLDNVDFFSDNVEMLYELIAQSSEIMSKYFGDSEKAVRELFGAFIYSHSAF